MKHSTPLGSRIAEVHNGSSLFTGDAGQGESNIRRWIIENDWLEAIVALPLNMFYNTGIATYIWVLTNRKPAHRQGKVQLIDATKWFRPLRKNLGQKNCELAEEDLRRIERGLMRGPEALGYGTGLWTAWRVADLIEQISDSASREAGLANEVAEAAKYVRSLLPPVMENERVRIEWRFLPSTQLGAASVVPSR